MPTLDQLLPLLNADPSDAFLRYAVAMEYAKQSLHADAMREFAELNTRHPDYVAGYFMSGRTAEQMGDLEIAKSLYKSGIEAAKRTGDTHAAGEISQALFAIE